MPTTTAAPIGRASNSFNPASSADGEGLGSQAAEPRSPAPKTWVIRAEYRGGNWPNTRNPAGGADGVWVGSVGGIAAKARDGTAGIGGDVLSTSRLTI